MSASTPASPSAPPLASFSRARGRYARIGLRVSLEHAGDCEIEAGLEVHGPEAAPAVVVLGGISADCHIHSTAADPTEGWWPGMVGPGRAVDTRRFRAIGIDFLGGPGTAGPRCPITTSDQARVLVSALDYLDATEATLVGASYGGMVALAAGAAFPERVSRIVAICTAHRPHPMATALRTLQRAIIERGAPNDTSAVVLARALAMTTYRSAIEFEARFDSSATWSAATPTFQVTDYLMARGAAFSKRFDRHDYLRLSESIDTHCVEPETVRVPTVLVSVDSDAVVPPFLADELARRLPALEQHIRLTSRFGHDAFLKETAAIARVISDALAADATSTPHQPSSRATTHAP